MWKNKTISVVLPAYNEEQSIREAVEGYFATGVVDEVIVVNNNSKDRTAEETGKTRARLVNETKQGYGAALTRGLKEASGDYVILSEPDGTFIPSDVMKLLVYAEECDMVCGTRTTPQLIWENANMGWFLRSGNLVVAKILELLYNTCSLSDCGCTMRLVNREKLQKFLSAIRVTKSHFLPEMVILAHRAGLRIIEIPVNYQARQGESKITGSWKGIFKTGFAMLWLIFTYRFMHFDFSPNRDERDQAKAA